MKQMESLTRAELRQRLWAMTYREWRELGLAEQTRLLILAGMY